MFSDWLSIITGTTTTGVDKVLDGRREDYLNNIQSSLKLTITNLKKQFATKHLN
jgi:hypothetical protein